MRSPLTSHKPLIAWSLLAIWVGVVVVLAVNDAFLVDQDVPPWPIIVSVTVPLAVFAMLWREPSTRAWLLGIDHRLVLALQLWRVLGAAFLFGFATDHLDAAFAVPAGVGDIATGVAALFLLRQVLQGTHTRRHVVWFTLLGVSDFIIALATGALVRPDGLELIPWILFPTLAVPFFSMVHVLNWHQLNTDHNRQVSHGRDTQLTLATQTS